MVGSCLAERPRLSRGRIAEGERLGRRAVELGSRAGDRNVEFVRLSRWVIAFADDGIGLAEIDLE